MLTTLCIHNEVRVSQISFLYWHIHM